MFGGGEYATAEGTYIQGKPEYTTCTDIAEIFSESDLESLQSLLGDRYVKLLKHIIEIGEIEEIFIENGRLWKAYWMPYHQVWCNIKIYDNGDIYVEGYSDDGMSYEYYTNTEDAEMLDIELLKGEKRINIQVTNRLKRFKDKVEVEIYNNYLYD